CAFTRPACRRDCSGSWTCGPANPATKAGSADDGRPGSAAAAAFAGAASAANACGTATQSGLYGRGRSRLPQGGADRRARKGGRTAPPCTCAPMSRQSSTFWGPALLSAQPGHAGGRHPPGGDAALAARRAEAGVLIAGCAPRACLASGARIRVSVAPGPLLGMPAQADADDDAGVAVVAIEREGGAAGAVGTGLLEAEHGGVGRVSRRQRLDPAVGAHRLARLGEQRVH